MSIFPSILSRPSTSNPYRMPDPSTHDDAEDVRRGAELVDEVGRPLPLVASRLRATAAGGLARLVLEQTFENPWDETLRITYRMPLPGGGAVSGYAFVIGPRTVMGVVDRKARARERFEEAIASGRTAALLEEERADVFTQTIGNVPARETIVARITIDLRLAWLPEGEWELRMPTVIGPRYLGRGTTEADAQAVSVEVAKNGTSARLHVELVVGDEIEGGGHPTSPSHAITTTNDGVTVLRDVSGTRLDRDVVVRWRVAKPEPSAALVVSRPADGAHARHAYGLVTVVPPEPRAAKAGPRDLVVLLDTSGSMSGGPLAQGKRVVAAIVAALGAEDTLELISFSNAPRRWEKTPAAATAEAKKRALAWLAAQEAGGATEMETAVMEALSPLRPGAQRQVVLVTDGYIGGEERILTRLHESLPPSCRMHVIGVGSGVNRTLSTSIARAGRGAEVLLGLDEDAERAAKRLVDRTRAPVMTDVVIEGDALVEHAPEHVPDVFAGAPLLAALKLRPEGGTIVVRGTLSGGATWKKTLAVAAVARGEGDPALAALYVREAVADLEVRFCIGRDREEVDRQIETLGIVFQIATRKTSWVAIDEVRSVDPTKGSRSANVPQELPYGTTAASFGLDAPEETTGAMPMASTRAMLRQVAPATAPAVRPSMAFGAPAKKAEALADEEVQYSAARRATKERVTLPPRAVAPMSPPPAAPQSAAQPVEEGAKVGAAEPAPMEKKRLPPPAWSRPWLAVLSVLFFLVLLAYLAWRIFH